MRDAQVDQTRSLVPADDVDRTAKRALRLRQKLACVFRHSKSVGRDGAHGGWMHARKARAEALQAFDCRFHRGGLDSSIAVEAGAEAQRLAPCVLPVDLAAFNAADLEPKAVRSEIDDGKSSGGCAGFPGSLGRGRRLHLSK